MSTNKVAHLALAGLASLQLASACATHSPRDPDPALAGAQACAPAVPAMEHLLAPEAPDDAPPAPSPDPSRDAAIARPPDTKTCTLTVTHERPLRLAELAPEVANQAELVDPAHALAGACPDTAVLTDAAPEGLAAAAFLVVGRDHQVRALPNLVEGIQEYHCTPLLGGRITTVAGTQFIHARAWVRDPVVVGFDGEKACEVDVDPGCMIGCFFGVLTAVDVFYDPARADAIVVRRAFPEYASNDTNRAAPTWLDVGLTVDATGVTAADCGVSQRATWSPPAR